jgi:hypothetical protein
MTHVIWVRPDHWFFLCSVEHRPTCVTTPLPGLNSGTRVGHTSTNLILNGAQHAQLAEHTCMHHTMSQTSVGKHSARTSTTQWYHGRHQPGHVLSWHMTHTSKHDLWTGDHAAHTSTAQGQASTAACWGCCCHSESLFNHHCPSYLQ